MPETEEQTTAEFQVQREDGSKFILTEVTTFLVQEEDGHRVPSQIEWFVDGKSVVQSARFQKLRYWGRYFESCVRSGDTRRVILRN
jgi:hypothetical protein